MKVSLVWGAGESDRETIAIGSLSREYKKFPLDFTREGGFCRRGFGDHGNRNRRFSYRHDFADAHG